ncbi:hypothetical protein GLOTRDRAFT_126409 [Gloeophyllum trabeum ATCC 11539]|uniref:CCHC-type domain-containing protein n=1 Tax=Gloeophyllum trabeum (strain ATCC 11539 / FP-39264 / Madison 617) TaxID=670483 RepID=S7QDL1_GLOTA|nr:uncharacterized protein GLOTRDRAFT_126409 [Gloeophyllum trabeum ATCC 11539]EPQ57916.1 hypothetical protein GLOTRDRAFT_126409 [Gloeophyllum trabeum ATCC 11539]
MSDTLPSRYDKHAPRFDPEQPRTLLRYFEDLADLLAAYPNAVPNEATKKAVVVKYMPMYEEELWKGVPEFSDDSKSFEDFKGAVLALYPAVKEDQRYSVGDMDRLVGERQRNDIISIREQGRAFQRGFQPELWNKIFGRLQIKDVDHQPDTPYGVDEVYKAAEFILHGTSAIGTTEKRPEPASSGPSAPLVKTEDLSSLVEVITKSISQALVAAVQQNAAMAPATSNRPAPLNYNCIYCGEHDHLIRRCPKVEEDIRCRSVQAERGGTSGPARRSDGLENPGQTSVHLLDTMLWEEVRASAAPQTTDMFHLDQRERIEALEWELFALRGKGKQVFDGVYVPPPNRSSNPSKESGVGPTGPAPSRAKSQPVREQPVAEAVRPAINRESPPHMSEGPIHPFTGARDVNRPRQAIPRSVEKGSAQAADASQAKEPAYRTQAPVYNPRISDLVFERSLKTPNISLTSEELLSIAPEVRAKYRDIVTPKKVPAPPAVRLQATIQEVEDEDDGPELPDVEQLIHSGSSIRPGVLVVPDPYEIYLRSLGPGETPKQLVVAKESHALRSIMGLIDNQEKVEAI